MEYTVSIAGLGAMIRTGCGAGPGAMPRALGHRRLTRRRRAGDGQGRDLTMEESGTGIGQDGGLSGRFRVASRGGHTTGASGCAEEFLPP